MKADIDNLRYVCEYCGEVIYWVTVPGKLRIENKQAVYSAGYIER